MEIFKYGIFVFLLPQIFAASLYQYGHPLSGFFGNRRQPSSQWLNPFFLPQNNGLQNQQVNDLFNSDSFFKLMPFENFFSQPAYDKTNTVKSNFDTDDRRIQPPSSQYQQESTPSKINPQLEDFDLSQLLNMINNLPRNEPSQESELPPQQKSSGVNHKKSDSRPQQSQNDSANLEQVSPMEFLLQMPSANTELPDDSNQRNMYNNENKSLPSRVNKNSNTPENVSSEKYEKQINNSVEEIQYNVNRDNIISLLSKILGSQDIPGSQPTQMNSHNQKDQTSHRKFNEESVQKQNYSQSEKNDNNKVNKNNADKQDLNEKIDSANSNTFAQRPPIKDIARKEKKIQNETSEKPINSIKERPALKNNERKETKATQTEPIQVTNYKQNNQTPVEKLPKEIEKQQNNNQPEQNIISKLNENATDKEDVSKLMKLINNSPNSEAIMSLLTKVLGSADLSSQLPILTNNPKEDNNDQYNSLRETKTLEKPSDLFKSNKSHIDSEDNKSKVSKLNDQSSNNDNENKNKHTNPQYNNKHVNSLETQIEKPPLAESNIIQSKPQKNQSNGTAVQNLLAEISDTVKLNLNGVKAIYEFVSSSFTNSNITEKLRLTLDISRAVVRGFQNTSEVNRKTLNENRDTPNSSGSFEGMNTSNFFPRDFNNDLQIFDTMRSFDMPSFIKDIRNNGGYNSDAAQFEKLLNNAFGNLFNDFGFNTNERNNSADQQISTNEYNVPQPLFEEVTNVLLENPPAPYKDNSQKVEKCIPELMKVIRNTFAKQIDEVTHGNQPNVSTD